MGAQPQAARPAREATGRAPGKLIVLGEHAVVYGYPALAMPIESLQCHATLTLLPEQADGLLEFVNASGTVGMAQGESAPVGWEGLAALLQALREAQPGKNQALRVRIDSGIPIGAGLGSGAALACAVARAWGALFGVQDTTQTVFDKIQIAERVAHGFPSGLDACTVLSGGPLLFDTVNGAQALETRRVGYWVIGHSGVQRQTVMAISQVAQSVQRDPIASQSRLARLGTLAAKGACLLASGDFQQLGKALDEAQGLLDALGVGHPRLTQLVDIAKNHGALGAKLTGAGMGGCVLALAQTRTAQGRVADAWRAQGFPFVRCIDGEGMSGL